MVHTGVVECDPWCQSIAVTPRHVCGMTVVAMGAHVRARGGHAVWVMEIEVDFGGSSVHE